MDADEPLPHPRRQVTTRAVLCAVLLGAGAAQGAPEYIESTHPPAGDTDATVEAMEQAFEAPRQRPAGPGAALRAGTLDLQLRNYYFDRRREGDSDSETWAQGGALAYVSPWWRDRLQVGATLYTSQKLYGPEDRDGALLLKSGQNGFSALGEAYLQVRPLPDVDATLYRQSISLPYLNGNDTRMVPNTFEALTLVDRSGERLVYGLGQVQRIKPRNASRFISMTEAAGIAGRHRGVSAAAARFTFARGSNIGAVNLYGWDYLNTFYSEINSRPRHRGPWSAHLSAQYTDQRSVGDELAGDIDTWSLGVMASAGIGGLVMTLAHTRTSDNAGISSPWGGKPSYLSLMLEDFDRAGENAWLVGLSTDFRMLGDNGFSGFVNYARGDTPDGGAAASADQSELDVTVDYRFRDGLLKDLWIRLRGAWRDRDDGGDLRDYRAIVNYDLKLF